MTLYFCTLFDKNFLLKGLALYDSLSEHCPDFRLFILCLDDLTYDILKKINLPSVTLLRLEELIDRELLDLKEKRKPGEFAWTCKPSLFIHLFKKHFEIEYITYLDSDIYLYSSPASVYEEIKGKSIIITPHRFPENKKYLEKKSGIYNAGTIIFRNDNDARECLNEWRKQCLDWCYDYLDNGRLGDQMYLDKWPEKYKNVYVLNRKGVNLGSWNIHRYKIKKINDRIYVDGEVLIWYHFHSLGIYESKNVIKIYPIFFLNKNIYYQYMDGLVSAYKKIKEINPHSNLTLDKKPSVLRLMIQWFKRKQIQWLN